MKDNDIKKDMKITQENAKEIKSIVVNAMGLYVHLSQKQSEYIDFLEKAIHNYKEVTCCKLTFNGKELHEVMAKYKNEIKKLTDDQ